MKNTKTVPQPGVVPYALADAPALIEHVLPVQKLSVESYKEQMAGSGKTLTALGSYWKGRKPLILNKACILGCLLPATGDLAADLEVFELLMGMDDAALERRLKLTPGSLPTEPYRELVKRAKRPEELGERLFDPVWDRVNRNLGTSARSFPELVEQLGIMRFGHRPRMGDPFCGSGQIPFEAARLGCDVTASDLNPIACMLTWGAFHIVGGSPSDRARLEADQRALVAQVQSEIDRLGVETDGHGWRAKVYLYCVEVRCPGSGWWVPLLPTRVISQSRKVIVELVPDPEARRYACVVRSDVTAAEMAAAERGTVRSDGRGQDPYLIHEVAGVEHRTRISSLRGDHRQSDGTSANLLRRWEKHDFMPRPDDLYQERLYAIQWVRDDGSARPEAVFRSVTVEDLAREDKVQRFVAGHLAAWQERGWIPDMRIEPGAKTDEPIRTRGWTYWHHLFNPRQLLLAGLMRQYAGASTYPIVAYALNYLSRLCIWHRSRDGAQNTYYNQALNTIFNFAVRASTAVMPFFDRKLGELSAQGTGLVKSGSAADFDASTDFFVSDPPYGDAVHYEEILDFFIAWLRKNPPPEFADWVWDSRRHLAIKGEDEAFRRGMVAAYGRMAACMPDNGIQVLMFTHQSGTLWADMTNIVWAAGMRVTAAWYVVTETDSALRDGAHVKGTVLLVLRKRSGEEAITRSDLAYELQAEVEQQVGLLTGLDQRTKARRRDENLFSDADLQMAGYAAALRVLTRYSHINGQDMTREALRPRLKGETTMVDELIAFAVDRANEQLVPQGIETGTWEALAPAERFYLKLLELEARGNRTLDNYQNFAKAFRLPEFRFLMETARANDARLKGAVALGKSEMHEGSLFGGTHLRGLLYAIARLVADVEGETVLYELSVTVKGFHDHGVRQRLIDLTEYLSVQLLALRADEASAARVLGQLLRGQAR
jgi:putative DNA methylase